MLEVDTQDYPTLITIVQNIQKVSLQWGRSNTVVSSGLDTAESCMGLVVNIAKYLPICIST